MFRKERFLFSSCVKGVIMFKKQVKQSGKTSNSMPSLQSRDDALFETLQRNKKVKKRKLIRMVVTILVILAVILIAGVSVLRRQVREQFGDSAAEVLSQQAEQGTISTVVSGSGMLLNVDTETITVPAGVEVTEIWWNMVIPWKKATFWQ